MVNLLLTIATLSCQLQRPQTWSDAWGQRLEVIQAGPVGQGLACFQPCLCRKIEGGCKDIATLLRGESEGGEEAMEVEENQLKPQ